MATYNVTLKKNDRSITLKKVIRQLNFSHTGRRGLPGNDGTIVAVQNTAPLNPNTGDLWVDTSV